MRLSISNIGWKQPQDEVVYEMMGNYGFTGLEIAPTRIIEQNPYEQLERAREWKEQLNKKYSFEIPSMQSIWFGKQENLFQSEEEKENLIAYTKKAIDFAEVIGCKNLVFGCPRNRNMPEGAIYETAVEFFRELGTYAAARKIVIGMEANPPIYNTNFINDTKSALKLIEEVNSEGFRLNLDVGTMLHNEESVEQLSGQVHLISHVHISEPWLKPVKVQALHKSLAQLLEQEKYENYVSIEMGAQEDLGMIESCMKYVREIF